jgi:hypothetical protein
LHAYNQRARARNSREPKLTFDDVLEQYLADRVNPNDAMKSEIQVCE